jgi:hypothetical protein
MEPLPERQYPLPPPPQHPVSGARRQYQRQRRPSMTWGIVRGAGRYFKAWLIIVTMVAAVVLFGLWALFSYGGPAVSKAGDSVSSWLQDHTTTTTTAP